jgi:pilus assembly protein CpaF
VLVNAHDEVWVDRGGGPGARRGALPDDLAVRRLAQRLAAPDRSAARRRPARGSTPGSPAGVRLHAVLPPVAPGGTCLSLRVARPGLHARRAGRGRLAAARRRASCSPRSSPRGRLPGHRRHRHRQDDAAVALLSLVDPGDRLLLVEDAGELAPRTRTSCGSRPGRRTSRARAVTLRDLVRQALRMRPDRVVVGEVRGGEVVDLLAALNTGHEGGCGTLHANSARDVPRPLEALAAVAGARPGALHSQLASGLRLAVHLVRARTGRRRVAEVCVLQRDAAGPGAGRRGLDLGRERGLRSARTGVRRAPGAAVVTGPRRGAGSR